MVYRSHVWVGVFTGVAVIAISITGIYLNHVDALGFWRPPNSNAAGSIHEARSLREIIILGLTAAHEDGLDVSSPRDVNRVVYRPGRGQVAVRFNDRRASEAVLDANTGAVLQVAPRDDATLEHLHTGEVIGQRGVIVSDVVAGATVLLAVGGLVLWLNRIQGSSGETGGAVTRRGWWVRLNGWVHLGGGLAVVVVVLLLAVTGVLLNHKRELGFMEEPFRPHDYEPQRREPMAWSRIVNRAIDGAPEFGFQSSDDVRFVDFRPAMGYAKVRFKDDRATEVIVDVYDGDVLNVSRRRDFFLEDIHSGLAWGGTWGRLAVDGAGALLILLTLNGLYLWIRPVWVARSRAEREVTSMVNEGMSK